MVWLEMWAFGMAFLTRSAVTAGIVALVAYLIWAKIKEDASPKSRHGTAIFLAAWLVTLAFMAFGQGRTLLAAHFIDGTSAETVAASLPAAQAQASGMAIRHVLPAAIVFGLVATPLRLIRRRWVQWLVAMAAYASLCTYFGFLDSLLAA